MSKSKIIEKIESLFKEESWGRIDPKDIGISRFKILDDLFNSILAEGLAEEALENCREHIAEQPASITAAASPTAKGKTAWSVKNIAPSRPRPSP